MSFREVARIAGVSHQAPYHYFESDLGIMRAIAQEGFHMLTEVMSDAGARYPDDSLKALETAGVAYVRFAIENLGHFRVMFQRSLVDIHDPKAPLFEGKQAFEVLLGLADAVRVQRHGHGMDRDRIALICWSAVHGAATLLTEGILKPDQGRISISADDVAKQVAAGITFALNCDAPKKKGGKVRARRKAT